MIDRTAKPEIPSSALGQLRAWLDSDPSREAERRRLLEAVVSGRAGAAQELARLISEPALEDALCPLATGVALGQSSELQNALSELERTCRSDAPVHIHGETGTGKELAARWLHAASERANKPFTSFNCAGAGESLLHSTLFGHRKGAFAGADRDQPGLFQQSNGGTLFLEEVQDIPPGAQAAMLRAMKDGEVVPVGATRPEKVDVRVISASHKDIREEVRAGRFRSDLYFRLVVLSVRLPSLKERAADIPLLATHFLDLFSLCHKKRVPGFTPEALHALQSFDWPGNVRELRNEVKRVVVLARDGETVALEQLSSHIRTGAPDGAPAVQPHPEGILIPSGLSYDDAVTTLERCLVRRALESSGGVIARAAESLQMERTRLAKLSRRLGVLERAGAR